MTDVPALLSRPVGPRIGRYDVLFPIASGGMATVYLARSEGARGFARNVALKLTHAHLTDAAPEYAATLLEEARIASRIKHRNVVSILDVGEDPVGLFLVMEYVEGDTLAGLRQGAINRSEAVPPRIGVRILLDALAGLHAAHELCDDANKPMEVVHRDFSPQNILIGLDGVAQLADFGIAKAADAAGQTTTGIVKGKVAYMSPEHARAHRIDRRADVWSAGIVAWEILAGRRLHASNEGVGTLLKVISETPPRLGTVATGIRPEVEEVVAHALEPNVDLRFGTAADFARDLAYAFGIMARVPEPEEVADYVRRISGTKLERRRAQVKDALKLHALAAAPPVDQGSDRAVLESGSETPPMSMSPDATFPDPMPPAPYTDGMPLTLSNRTKKEPALSSLRRSAALRLVWQLGGTLGLAVSAGVGLVLFIQGSDRSRDAAAVTVGRGGALAASESAPSPSPPPAVPLEPQRTDPPPRVKLHANAKLTSLRINARFLPVAPPVTDLAFERLAEDGDGGLTVVATALDGRKRAMTLAPGASSLEVDFAPLPARQTVGTPSRPAPVAAPPPKNDEIPPNPFTQAGHGANPSGSP